MRAQPSGQIDDSPAMKWFRRQPPRHQKIKGWYHDSKLEWRAKTDMGGWERGSFGLTCLDECVEFSFKAVIRFLIFETAAWIGIENSRKKKRTHPDGTKGMFAGRSGRVPPLNGMFFRAATWIAANKKFSSIARYFVAALFLAAMCIKVNTGLGNPRNSEMPSVAFFTRFWKVTTRSGHSCRRENA